MIVVIDEGVDSNHSRLKNCSITGVNICDKGGTICIEHGDFNDQSGHGTAVAAIIHKIVPETPIFSIKLSSDTGRLSENLLSEAIIFCQTLSDVSIVNISMGVANSRASAKLYEACSSLYLSGVPIVAASHNFITLQCYPAGLPFVYSVGCGLVRSRFDYHYANIEEKKILAKGGSQRIAWKDNSFKISSGTSFAAAHFSGILQKMINSTDTPRSQIDDLIKSHSTAGIEEFIYIQKKTELIASQDTVLDRKAMTNLGEDLFTSKKSRFPRNIAVFPASEKETKTLIELSESMSASLILAIDYPRNFADLLRRQQNIRTKVPVIAREPKEEEFELFDTISIGYFMDMPVESNIIFGTRLIEECIKRNKNLILFDNDVHHLVNRVIHTRFPAYSGRIHLSTVKRSLLKDIRRFDHLPEVKVPVLAVIGTASRQGKFTTQIRVREILQQKGYKVSFISTEPQGALFDAAFTFPYGYNSNVELHLNEWGNRLATVIRGVQHFNAPSIILTGIQGGILPRSTINHTATSGSILASIHYLTGASPDAVFCSVNPTDSVDHIRQTIQTVYNYCKSPCLLCMMTPLTREFEVNGKRSLKKFRILDKEEMNKIMSKLSIEIGIPVIDVMQAESEKTIISTIEDFFS